jgi:hypothetical protein
VAGSFFCACDAVAVITNTREAMALHFDKLIELDFAPNVQFEIEKLSAKFLMSIFAGCPDHAIYNNTFLPA